MDLLRGVADAQHIRERLAHAGLGTTSLCKRVESRGRSEALVMQYPRGRPIQGCAAGRAALPDTYGEMGVRHEDIIFITETGAENMTKWTGSPEEPAVL